MQCPNGCVTPMQEKKLEKIFYRNNQHIVISDLLMDVCPECLQESMSLSTARSVEEILKGERNAAGKFVAELYTVK